MRLPSIVALVVSTVAVAAAPPPAFAHPGGLNAEGCDTSRKTGDYYCHRGRIGGTERSKSQMLRSIGAYRSGTEARAAGAAPVYRGEPGYGPCLDCDNDGVGCE